MAIYRNVHLSFWTDPKISEFSADEKYMYLYLLTNPHTNLAGCYAVSMKQIVFETDVAKAKVIGLIDALTKHGVIAYNEEYSEVLVVNWYKYNWNKSDKFRKSLIKQIKDVKCDAFQEYLMGVYNGMDTVWIGYGYGIDRVSNQESDPMDTTAAAADTVTVTVTDTVTDTDTVSVEGDSKGEIIKRIVDHLNLMCGTNYRPNGKDTKEKINARLEEGFTEDDCIRVIDNMVQAWGNDERMRQYLRPSTLFAQSKFEGYLNRAQPTVAVPRKKSYIEIAEELERQQENDIWI